MPRNCRHLALAASTAALLAGWSALATAGAGAPNGAVEQFLEQQSEQQPTYRATRRLVAENRGRSAWLDVTTEFAPETGFRYQVIAEGGSGFIRGKVLRPLLDGEQKMIARGEVTQSALTASNYAFQADGIDAEGLAAILLSPRRQEGVLVKGTLLVQPADGTPVRLLGRLARSPSFWVKHVDIVRSYARMNGVVLPIALESTAQLRVLGPASLRMTYHYSEVDSRTIADVVTHAGS